ncbi:mannose-6-phosphate isomerase [Clostridium sp. MCC353]|uniref:class I mannose-6-phosphate isomerase n=1 Tax=Clostridium sp. MCC353 TaxID=2592646 RepID=UPI001C00AC4F|nr:class I mannose-6-phosphate isomerase [Clostridium sp. MCC353]MBT9775969.1 mannose-6-phosphate isomerase [Clostridium sp. MCC353]
MEAKLFEKPWRLKTNKIQYLIKGGELLKRFFGYEDEGNLCSQVWIASTVTSSVNGNEGLSQLEMGDEDRYLKDIIDEYPVQIMGEEHVKRWGTSTGVLIKMLNSCDRLLVQAHPDQEKAKKYFHSDFGKTESWYVLDLDTKTESPCIYAGFKPGVNREMFRRLIEIQDTKKILDCLYRFEIQKGQVIFIPAGLPHTLGEGSLMIEIQEPVDITLRAERIRPDGSVLPEESLHSGIGLEALLDCFDFTVRSEEETRDKIFQPSRMLKKEAHVSEEVLIGPETTTRFGMNRIRMDGTEGRKTYSKENGAFTIVLVTEGSGRIVTEAGEEPLNKGTELWLPNGVKTYRYETGEKLEIVECYPPQT